MSDQRSITTRLSDDGEHLVIVERWLDRQVSPPKWRSKNRRRKLSAKEIEYYRQRSAVSKAFADTAQTRQLSGSG
jgi:hypothetical protein